MMNPGELEDKHDYLEKKYKPIIKVILGSSLISMKNR